MTPLARAALLAAALPVLTGCPLFRGVGLSPNEPDPSSVQDPDAQAEPDHVVIRRVLVSFEGTDTPGVTRTREAAERLALQVHEMARSGRDFGELVRLYSDDRHGDGSYAIANWGVANAIDEIPRERFAERDGAAVAEAGFVLEPGEMAMVPHDPEAAPLGWNVVLRVR